MATAAAVVAVAAVAAVAAVEMKTSAATAMVGVTDNTPSKLVHQKRYYAPFMGYKFIAYLCP
jgi:hypothetical protein